MPTTLSRERVTSLLAGAARTHILIVGDAMLDVYLRGDVERISPEAPVPVVRVRERRHALGGAANVAQNVAALGASPRLVAIVGADAPGRRLREMLVAIGATTDSIVEADRATTTKTRVLARAQQVVRVDEEDDGELSAGEEARVIRAIESAAARADALVLQDYNKGLLSPAVIARALALGSERNIPVVVDPKYRNFFSYRGATVFKPNRRELEAALGAAMDVDHPETLPAIVARLNVKHLLLTLGDRGMLLVSAQGDVHRVPTAAREVYDVVGAGDTVTAFLAAMLAAGATMREAAIIANFAAGVEVGKLGAATVAPEEVLAAYDALDSTAPETAPARA